MVEATVPASCPSSPRLTLDLDTLIIRPTVRIDGVTFEVRTAEELSVLENRRLFRLGKRIEAFEALDNPSDAEIAEYCEALGAICRKVLLEPDEAGHPDARRHPEIILRLRTRRSRLRRLLAWLGRERVKPGTEAPRLYAAIERLSTPQRGAIAVTFSHLWLTSLLRTTRAIQAQAEAVAGAPSAATTGVN